MAGMCSWRRERVQSAGDRADKSRPSLPSLIEEDGCNVFRVKVKEGREVL